MTQTLEIRPATGEIMPQFSRDQIDLLKRTVCQGSTDDEFRLFVHVAQRSGLDPFARQIHAVKRWDGKLKRDTMVIQTGIDGYRSTAERTREYAGSDEATFEACDCQNADSPPGHPKVARVVVHRLLPNGHMVDQTGIARWHELKPAHTKGQFANEYLDAMWWRMPFNQLAKCAEANGLRIAFPRVLGGVYIEEEMQQADAIEGTATVLPTAAERIAARRQASQQPTEPVEGVGLSRDDFLAALVRAGISQETALARSQALFPGVAGSALTDDQRATLLMDLLSPTGAPPSVDEAELDAALDGVPA